MTLRKRRANTPSQPRCSTPKSQEKPPFGSHRAPQAAIPAHRGNAVFLLAEMFFCLVGINLCFGWWSVKQERVIKNSYDILVKDTVGSGAAQAGFYVEKVFLSTSYGITLTQTLTGFLISATLLGFHNIARRLTASQDAAAKSVDQGSPSSLALHDVPGLLVMGFSNIIGSSLSYAAMRRLSYPVALTAKMIKMLPVMLVGSLWHHTRYPARKVLSCLLITGGVITFALLDRRSSSSSKKASVNTTGVLTTSSSSLFGMVLIVMSLLMDGYTNSTQDVLVKRHCWSGLTLMMWANLASVVCASFTLVMLECGEQPWAWLCSFVDVVLSSVLGSGGPLGRVTVSASLSFLPFHDLSRFLSFLANSREARNDVFLMSVLNALGQLFIFHTISLFGTLAVTAMTLLRKVGSVLLSIYVHQHPVQPSQWAALATIFVGVVSEGYINIQDASQRQKQRAAASLQTKTIPTEESSLHGTQLESAAGKVPVAMASPPTMSNSSSTAMMTDSRSTTLVCATMERS